MPYTRRQFLCTTVAAACAGCGVGCSSSEDGPVAAAGSLTGAVAAGTPADYPHDGVYDRLAASAEVLIFRQGARLFATSAVCTHKRAILTLKGGQVVCPKHGSRFDAQGVPQDGPARQPLPRYAIALDGEGRLIVDRTRILSPDDWEGAGAFVAVR